jgi:hypothetical protein
LRKLIKKCGCVEKGVIKIPGYAVASGRIYNDANLLGSDFWKRESIGSGHNDEVSLSTTGTKNIVGIMSYWVPSVYNSLCTAD